MPSFPPGKLFVALQVECLMPEPGRAQALGLPHVDLIRRSGRPGPGLSCAPRTGPFTLPLLRSRWRIPRKQARHLPSCSHVLAWDAHRELYTNLGPQLETCGRSGGQWWKCPKARSTNCRATATVAKDLIQLWVGGWRQLLANHWWQIAGLWQHTGVAGHWRQE